MRKIVKPAYEDPHHSVDLFDGDRLNGFGEMYCVAPAILPSEVNLCWNEYLHRRRMGNGKKDTTQ